MRGVNCTANRRGLGSVRLYWIWRRAGDSKLEGAPGVRHPSEWRASQRLGVEGNLLPLLALQIRDLGWSFS